MSNPYYHREATFDAGTAARGDVVEGEYDLVKLGFDKLDLDFRRTLSAIALLESKLLGDADTTGALALHTFNTFRTQGVGAAYEIQTGSRDYSYVDGLRFFLRPQVRNDKNATLNVDNLGARPLYYNGFPLLPGTLEPGHFYLFIYNQELRAFELINGYLAVDQPVIITVAKTGADAKTVQEALDWIEGYSITVTGTVTIRLLKGVHFQHKDIRFYHKHGERVFIEGVAEAGDPVSIIRANNAATSVKHLFQLSGCALGGLKNLKIDANLVGDTAIRIFNSGNLLSGGNVHALQAKVNGAQVIDNSSVEVTGLTATTATTDKDGVLVSKNSNLNMTNAAGHSATIRVAFNSNLVAENYLFDAKDANDFALFCGSSSYAFIRNSTVRRAVKNGVRCTERSFINATDVTYESNTADRNIPPNVVRVEGTIVE